MWSFSSNPFDTTKNSSALFKKTRQFFLKILFVIPGKAKLEADFDDITHAQLTARGRKNEHYWTFSRRSAEDVKLSIANNVMDQAGLEIVARLKARGIETKDDPDGP